MAYEPTPVDLRAAALLSTLKREGKIGGPLSFDHHRLLKAARESAPVDAFEVVEHAIGLVGHSGGFADEGDEERMRILLLDAHGRVLASRDAEAS